jgi:hypothetical protein
LFQNALEIGIHKAGVPDVTRAFPEKLAIWQIAASLAAVRNIKFTLQVRAIEAIEAEAVEVYKPACASRRTEMVRVGRSEGKVLSLALAKVGKMLDHALDAILDLKIRGDQLRIEVAQYCPRGL